MRPFRRLVSSFSAFGEVGEGMAKVSLFLFTPFRGCYGNRVNFGTRASWTRLAFVLPPVSFPATNHWRRIGFRRFSKFTSHPTDFP